jgi:hypothetical protein
MCLGFDPSFAGDQHSGDLSWNVIVAAIRHHASAQPVDIRRDLNQWADLIEALAELEATPAA